MSHFSQVLQNRITSYLVNSLSNIIYKLITKKNVYYVHTKYMYIV